tara:strand:+ start:491 stop:1894 length:1404 start_codon:yes stop_codon:yes gene_type:complete
MLNRFYKTIHNKYYKIFRFIFFLRYLFLIFLSTIALFLAIPNYFDYNKRIKIINDYLFKNYQFEVKDYEKIEYQALPKPKIIIKKSKIKVKSSKLKFKVEDLNIYPSLISIYNYDRFNISKIILENVNVDLKTSEFKFLSNFFLIQKDKISLKNLNLAVKNKKKTIVTLYNISFSNYGYNKNLIKGEIFKKKFKIKLSKNFQNINFKLLKTDIKGEIDFKDPKKNNSISGIFKFKILNTNLKFDFIYDEQKFKINNAFFRNKDLSINNESLIILKPFLDVTLKFDIASINSEALSNLDIEEFLKFKNVIKKINSKNEINFKSKKLSKNLIDDLNLKINLAHGRANYKKNFLISDSLFECSGYINLLEEYPLLFFNCFVTSKDKEKLFKRFSIKLKDSKKSFRLNVKGNLSILNNKINFDNIIFDGNNHISKEDMKYFKDTFQNILFDETFFKIFSLGKIKEFILEIS